MKSIRILVGILLLAGGFFLGTAWKKADNTKNVEDKEAVLQFTNDEATDEETGEANSDDAYDNVDSAPITPKFGSAEAATINLFETSAPSVCFITTSNLRRRRFSRDITEIQSGSGSGFVWDKNGHIITNYHVIQSADRAKVTLADGSSYDAELVGAAPSRDLAVLKISIGRKNLRPIPVGKSDNLKVGQSVFAIGNPFGLDQTLTTGIVSALGREIQSVSGGKIRGVIQTDAAINPGNSGGPLLDSSGRLIGVNTAIYSPSGASAGIGFSIPVDEVKWVVPELIKYGEIQRPFLGISINNYIQRRIGNNGVVVDGVTPNSAADKAGLQPTMLSDDGDMQLGDIIIGINNDPVRNFNELLAYLQSYRPGDRVTLKLIRNEKEVEVPVVLTAQE
ncbi:MAG: trypsin-like peptidase domain-containing protein [Bacteroidota bacterium]